MLQDFKINLYAKYPFKFWESQSHTMAESQSFQIVDECNSIFLGVHTVQHFFQYQSACYKYVVCILEFCVPQIYTHGLIPDKIVGLCMSKIRNTLHTCSKVEYLSSIGIPMFEYIYHSTF